MSDQQQKQEVVELTGAGIPADQGLSSLGLLMQLAGNLLAAYGGLLAFTMLFAMRGSGQTLWMIVLLGACITRSIFHRNAGSQLLYGNASLTTEGSNQRLGGIRRYIVVAVGQALLVGAMLGGKFHLPSKLALGVTLGLLVWPAALAVLLQLPRFKRYANDVPITEDKGFEGASILMTVLGLAGLIATGTLLLLLLDLPGKALTQGFGVLLMLSLAMLVVRSVLHVQAGLSGLRETSVDRSVELANRYANFGVISSFCAGGAMLLFFLQAVRGSGDGAMVFLVVIVGLCWMLMSWPLIIRRFFSDRQFADLLAGDQAHPHRRAPDAGLTGLGWLLFACAALNASFLIPQMLFGDAREMREMQAFMALGGASGLRSLWFSVGITVLQAWAGYELIRMSPQSRVIASVFGIVGAIVTVYINWPLIQALKHMRGFSENQMLMFAPLALGLILPIATLVLVNRKIAPTARARFRPKPTETPAAPA
jgi:hypothetical protein